MKLPRVREWLARRSALQRCLLGVGFAKIYGFLVFFLLFANTPVRDDENGFVFRSGRQSESARRVEIQRNFWDRLAPYDGQWYLDIARHGYRKFSPAETKDGRLPPGNYAFFPLLPVFLRATYFLSAEHGDKIAIVLLLIASAAGAVVLWKLAQDNGVDATLALLLLLAYPSSAFQFVLYTEGLFLLFASLTLRFSSHRKIVPACICAALAGLSRPQGVLLALPLGAEFVLPHLRSDHGLRSRKAFAGLAATATPLSGFLAQGVVSFFLVGSPLGFMEIQSSWGRTYGTGGVLDAITGVVGYRGPPMDLLGLLIGVAMLPVIWKRLPLAMALFASGMVLLPLSTGSILSLGRFISVSPPHFLALAIVLSPRPKIKAIALTSFLTLQILVSKGLIGWYFVG